jgi:hypothetical protein
MLVESDASIMRAMLRPSCFNVAGLIGTRECLRGDHKMNARPATQASHILQDAIGFLRLFEAFAKELLELINDGKYAGQ